MDSLVTQKLATMGLKISGPNCFVKTVLITSLIKLA